MAEKSIDLEMQRVAHSIDPKAPEHKMIVVASIHYADGREEVVKRCTGCPLEQWGSH